MATPIQILYEIRDALDDSDDLPRSVNYLVQEADMDGHDADVKIPVVQITPVSSARITDFNTDAVERITDGSGNEIGRRYHAEYQMVIQIDVLTVDDRTDDNELIRSLTNSLRNALYQYDSAGPSTKLEESVWRFVVDEGERIDDLTMTPTLRRWRQDVTVWSYEVFDTTEDYIVDVNTPQASEFNDTDDDGIISNT